MAGHRIFVYGTLRTGGRLHGHLKGQQEVGPGKTVGMLYDVGSFPAAVFRDDIVPDAIPRHAREQREIPVIFGEVWEVDPETLARLDMVEGYYQNDRHNSLYVRTIAEVWLDTGRYVACSVYEWNREVDGLKRIESGDYLKYLKGE
jgi:gamma-glutamylcyclotransferase (GGCT)/AIG2-like uncharacterized protein YtfP